MSSSAIRLVAIVLGLLAIILAIVGWRMSRSFAEHSAPVAATQAAQPPAPQFLVVVATKPLAANVAIASGDVVLAPVTIAPTEYFANVEDVVGRTPLIDIDAGAPVVPRLFKDSNQIARSIPPGFRALSLKVDDVVGVGGFVRPGDKVDLVIYIKQSTDTATGEQKKSEDIATQARLLLKDVLVIAYEDHLVEPPKGIEKNDPNKQAQQQRRERTAVVAVPEAQVTRVLLGVGLGDLRLALIGTKTEEELAAAAAAAAVAAGDPGISDLPVSDVAKADAKAKANEPLDQVITATELAKLETKRAPGRRQVQAPRPGVQIYRGSKLETVYQ